MRAKVPKAFNATIVDGGVVFDVPPNLPDGTRVEIERVGELARTLEHRADNVIQLVIRPDSPSDFFGTGFSITDREWHDASHPELLLLAVQSRLSPRKSRLFSTACCCRIAHLLPAQPGKDALAASEAFADGSPDWERIEEYRHEFHDLAELMREERRQLGLSSSSVEEAAFGAMHKLMFRIPSADLVANASARALGEESERPIQSRLLRCVVAPPAATSLSVAPWRTSTVVAIARGMYDSRDFADVPVLADALEDAGCSNSEVLDHCRGPGPHVRGCWVVDLVLDKE